VWVGNQNDRIDLESKQRASEDPRDDCQLPVELAILEIWGIIGLFSKKLAGRV
jgi:hypothetical protein